jgi:hypothetical protein
MSVGAQSEVIGVILLLTISITAISVILLFGQPVITGAQEDVQFDRMENEFSLLDAGMSSSVLGASESQSVSLNVEGGRLESNPDASWMNVTYEDASGTTSTLANITMGNLRYVQDGKTLAYEGGGVWRSNEGEDFTSMVSSPEFSYRGSTLTLPAYDIESETVVSGSRNSIKVESTNDPNLVFPDEDLDNPLQKGNVTITVKTEYYRGWESFFRDRTTGAIEEVREDENEVVFSLEVPTELLLNKGIQYQPGGDPDHRGSGSLPTTERIEVDLPSTDTVVQPELDKCFSSPVNPNCVDITSLTSSEKQNLDEDKLYYATGDYAMTDEYGAPDANVTILVEDTLEYNIGGGGEFKIGTENANPVKVYAGGDLDLQGGKINTGSDTGNSSMFITYVGGELQGPDASAGTGSIDYTGVIYAPNTDMGDCGGPRKIAGTANIKGTIVGDNVCVQGNSVVDSGDELTLDLSPEVSLVRYLHITENDIRVSG